MHEYRRFIQSELDARGWRQADLVRHSGLSRQLVSSILRDTRDHLGQMPEETTMQALADGFGIPVERVRTAAARSLTGYTDDGAPLTADLRSVPIDALLLEIKRRVTDATQSAEPDPATPAAGAPREANEDEKTKPADLNPSDQARGVDELGRRRQKRDQPPLPEQFAASEGEKGIPDPIGDEDVSQDPDDHQ